jgi:hypothetical protein
LTSRPVIVPSLTGRRDEARELLREALAGFESVDALPFAERARRELRAAGAVTRSTTETGAAELTAHELRVAQLVAQGSPTARRPRRYS